MTSLLNEFVSVSVKQILGHNSKEFTGRVLWKDLPHSVRPPQRCAHAEQNVFISPYPILALLHQWIPPVIR